MTSFLDKEAATEKFLQVQEYGGEVDFQMQSITNYIMYIFVFQLRPCQQATDNCIGIAE